MTLSIVEHGPSGAESFGTHFTQVYNAMVRDNRISGTAFKAYMVIRSHRNGYGVSVEAIARCMKEGVSAVKSALRELETYGYLARTRSRMPDGKLGPSVYRVTDIPDGFTITAAPAFQDEVLDDQGQQPTVDESPQAEPSSENPTADQRPVVQPPVADSGTKKNKEKNNNPKKTPEVLRTSGGNPARTRENATTNNHAPAAAAQTALDLPTGQVQDHPHVATPVGGGGSTAGLTVAQRADRLAKEWWDSLDIKPVGKGTSKDPAERQRRAMHALKQSIAGVLEAGWDDRKVAWVLRERARTIPRAEMLEIWLREESEKRRQGGGGQVRQFDRGYGRGGRRPDRAPFIANYSAEERAMKQAWWDGEATPRREAQ